MLVLVLALVPALAIMLVPAVGTLAVLTAPAFPAAGAACVCDVICGADRVAELCIAGAVASLVVLTAPLPAASTPLVAAAPRHAAQAKIPPRNAA
jgi:hypothetical protein